MATWLIANWKWIAVLALVSLVLLERSQYGDRRYEDGKTAERNAYNASVAEASKKADATEGRQQDATRTIDVGSAADRQKLNAADGRVRDLEKKLRAALRVEPSRVCIDAGTGASVPSTTGATDQPDGATGGQGSSAGAPRDIAGDLAQFAKRCEQDRLTVDGWQRWAEAMKQLE